MHFDKLYDIVDKYNRTYHRTIKIKLTNVKSSINFDSEVDNKDPKFKGCEYVRIQQYKSNFAKGYQPNWSEKLLLVGKVKNALQDLNGEKIVGSFIKKNCKM